VSKDLRNLLLEYRDKKTLSQEQMADYIGVSLRTYQAIEVNGEVSKLDTLLGILDKINIHPAQYFAGYGKNVEIEIDLGAMYANIAKLNAVVSALTQTIIEMSGQLALKTSVGSRPDLTRKIAKNLESNVPGLLPELFEGS